MGQTNKRHLNYASSAILAIYKQIPKNLKTMWLTICTQENCGREPVATMQKNPTLFQVS